TYLHSFGVPLEKTFAVPNAPGFSIDAMTIADVESRRSGERNGPLRLLYMGRLDRQKGIDRVYGTIAQLRDRNVVFEAVIVGGEILADSPSTWTARLKELGCDVRAPVFSSRELTKLLAWGDVLLMPSRWEGAPLIIAEAQQLGCVPIATAVGAVGELIIHGENGLLVDQRSDAEIVEHMAQAVLGVARDRQRLRLLAKGCLETAAQRSWTASFSAFLDWCTAMNPASPQPQASALPRAEQASGARPKTSAEIIS
ncbi:MAG TPA: glycosyltransferase family 4 protein, partial [Mesorhizobium sp.]|nr:glycosyltransferase family 4 protein [Mesorhizobium sp.]